MSRLVLAVRLMLFSLLLACLSESTGVAGVFPKAAEPGMVIVVMADNILFQSEHKAQIEIGGQEAHVLGVLRGTEAEVLVPDLPPGKVQVRILGLSEKSVSAGYLTILPASSLRLTLSFRNNLVDLMHAQPRSGEFRHSAKPGESRLSFDVLNAQDCLFFTGAVEHPTHGRFEIYDIRAQRRYDEYNIRRLAPQSQAVFTIDIPNFLGKASSIEFFEVDAGVDLTTSSGRKMRRPLNKIDITQTGSALWDTVEVQCKSDSSSRNNNKGCCTTVLDNGDPKDKFDIVFIGDGFTNLEQGKFNEKVKSAVRALEATQPFKDVMDAFNIWRVNVVSPESGIYVPAQRKCRNTALYCRYDYPPLGRLIKSDSSQKCTDTATYYAPGMDIVVVLVNDTTFGGGTGYKKVFASISPRFMGRIITHELGHEIGDLADEYVCMAPKEMKCENTYPKNETPYFPNLDTLTLDPKNRHDSLKWSKLIKLGTDLPTKVDNPPGVVGAWEGGGYYRYGIYRPQRNCHMDSLASEFCAVCDSVLREKIRRRYMPSIPCQYLATEKTFDLIWNQPQKWRWSLPQSWNCHGPDPLSIEVDIKYELRGVPNGFRLEILDELDEVVAQGRPSQGGFRVSFRENRAKQYFVELITPETTARKKAFAKKLEIITAISVKAK